MTKQNTTPTTQAAPVAPVTAPTMTEEQHAMLDAARGGQKPTWLTVATSNGVISVADDMHAGDILKTDGTVNTAAMRERRETRAHVAIHTEAGRAILLNRLTLAKVRLELIDKPDAAQACAVLENVSAAIQNKQSDIIVASLVAFFLGRGLRGIDAQTRDVINDLKRYYAGVKRVDVDYTPYVSRERAQTIEKSLTEKSSARLERLRGVVASLNASGVKTTPALD